MVSKVNMEIKRKDQKIFKKICKYLLHFCCCFIIMFLLFYRRKNLKYFEIKNGKTYYNNLDMQKLAENFGTSTKIVFLDIIEKQIKTLKKCFGDAIKKVGYNGKFIYLNANKANYSSEMVFTAFKFCDGLETSSHYDLEYTHKLTNLFDEQNDKPIYANGFKTKGYLDKIVSMHKSGVKVVDIVDSMDELDYLLSKEYESPLEIGVRINLKGLYGHDGENDRFGLSKEELIEFKKKLQNQNKLKLTTIHFHQRGFSFEEDKFYQNITKACEKYAEFFKDFKTLTTLDIGGGTPWSYEGDFNYEEWSEKLIETLKDYFDKKQIKHPNLVIENGKYTMKDAIINLYEVIGRKKTNESFVWALLNTRLMEAIPEYYMCGEPMKFVPVNNIDAKMEKAKLAGITCDCDDVYAEDENFVMIPEKQKEKQIIAILGTGSYQESLTSQASVRHCLIPAEKRIVSFIQNGERKFLEVEQEQSAQNVFDLTKLNKKYLEQFS